MTKKLKTKIEKQIKAIIGESFVEADQIAIDELISWLDIADFCKTEILEDAKDNNSLGWQTMTKYSMASKQIQSYLKTLGISRADRIKIKVVEKNKEGFDLNKFLNEN